MDLQHFLGAVRNRWKLVVVFLVLGVGGAAVVTAVLTPMYDSTARLFISTQATAQVDPYAGGIFASQRVASYADLAKDPAVLQGVIDELDLGVTPKDLADDVVAEAKPNSVILEVTARSDNPYAAQEIAAAEARAVEQLVTDLEKPKDSDEKAPITARIAGEASFSDDPVSPDLRLNLLAGALLGLLVGISGAILREMFDTSIRTPEDVQAVTNAVVMATVPFDSSVDEHPLISDVSGHNDRIEAFRVLRTNLQFVDLDSACHVLVVTSAVPDEGKTVTATNLAISMAQAGRAVLLMDCDLRKPRVAEILGLEDAVGALSVLVGRASLEECVQKHESGIDFLGTGPRPPNPAEVLETQAMRNLLADVRSRYDVVIIDAPPLLPVADPAILASEVDGVLLVTRHGKTSRVQLKHAAERIEAVGGNILGALLNMTPRKSGANYGYGYGYGSEPEEGLGRGKNRGRQVRGNRSKSRADRVKATQ